MGSKIKVKLGVLEKAAKEQMKPNSDYSNKKMVDRDFADIDLSGCNFSGSNLQ